MQASQNYPKKILMTGNHSGVITHLETVILKCEVKWAIGGGAIANPKR